MPFGGLKCGCERNVARADPITKSALNTVCEIKLLQAFGLGAMPEECLRCKLSRATGFTQTAMNTVVLNEIQRVLANTRYPQGRGLDCLDLHYVDAIDRAGLQAQIAAGAITADDAVHHLWCTNDRIHRAGDSTKGTANAFGLTNDRDSGGQRLSIGGIKGHYRTAKQFS